MNIIDIVILAVLGVSVVFGLARGVLLLYIFFTVVPIVMAVVPIEQLQTIIDGSLLAPMFDSQIIMTILNGGV